MARANEAEAEADAAEGALVDGEQLAEGDGDAVLRERLLAHLPQRALRLREHLRAEHMSRLVYCSRSRSRSRSRVF